MPVPQESAFETLGSAYGGHGGAPFDDRPEAASGPIMQITLRSGSFVDVISLTYGDLITHHGGLGGHPHQPQPESGEYITHVEGSAGDWLDSLKLTTSSSRNISGGGHGGNPFTLKTKS